MTGIERLRGVAGFWSENNLDDIVEQIEREHVSRMRVLSVVTEMERHVSGVEGAEDSPVARWARELREALGGDGRDHAADVSVSAYDLLPPDEREAIAWVREHGGIESVKAQRRESMPRAAYERKKAGFLDHIAECETALGRRREIISELNHRASDLTRENAELRKRAMPEGYEWPRYESGEPVMLGDSVVKYVADGEFEVRSIEFREGVTYLREGFRTEGVVIVLPGERVKRSEPKVLDADGVEIRVGDTVWSTREPKSGTVVYAYPPGDDGQPSVKVGAFWHHASELTHRAPVLAADGKPLREGETVFDKDTGDRFEVDGFSEDGFVVCWDVDKCEADIEIKPSQLTHERPETDSWGRLEEDAGKLACEYFGHVGGETCETCPGYTDSTPQGGRGCRYAQMADLVRRAKKLAERGQ